MEKVIDITAKRDGFRRAGIAHSEATTTYPLSKFTQAQLEQLQNEPMLVVAIRNADDQQAGPSDELKQQVLQLERDLQILVTQEADARKQVADLTSELDSERQNVSRLTSELTAEREQAAAMATELEGERQKVTDLTAQLEAATKKGK